ncbi:MAG: TolC family protein, partial [Acidobacteria bacterium]|nr:TolC family protein [Acidobacteriota bacterium]
MNTRKSKLRTLILVASLLSGAASVRAQVAAAQGEAFTLEQAVQTALAKNPALKAQAEESSVARAQTAQARAAWLPRVDFSQSFL